MSMSMSSVLPVTIRLAADCQILLTQFRALDTAAVTRRG